MVSMIHWSLSRRGGIIGMRLRNVILKSDINAYVHLDQLFVVIDSANSLMDLLKKSLFEPISNLNC
jgi:hypothetical protein